MANAERTSTINSLPSHPLGRFLSQGQYSFNIAVFTTSSSNFSQEQPAPTSLHTVLAFIIPAILNVIELKYQGKKISPFDTHPFTMWVSIACLLAYWFAYAIAFACFLNFLSPNKVHAVHCIMTLLGSLSVGSLASIIFPDSVQLSLFLLYTLLTLCGLFHTQLKLQCRWIQQMVLVKLFGASYPQERRIRRSSTGAHWLVQHSSVNHGNILPL